MESSIFINKCIGLLLSLGRFKTQTGNSVERLGRGAYFTFPGLDNEIGEETLSRAERVQAAS